MSRPTAAERLRRLLAIVPWLSAHSPVGVEEVCERFDIDRRTLLADLEVLPYVGVPPYTPDTMIGVDIDDDHISVILAEPFDRPLRITPAQALALIAAGHHIRQLPGVDETDPLPRALTKLAQALDVDPEQVHIDLGGGEERVHASLLAAITQGRQVEIIKLYGSMELAPLVGLADVIVDLVDTGNTLRANGLEPKATIADISSRLIVNKASMRMKHNVVQAVIEKLKKAVTAVE